MPTYLEMLNNMPLVDSDEGRDLLQSKAPSKVEPSKVEPSKEHRSVQNLNEVSSPLPDLPPSYPWPHGQNPLQSGDSRNAFEFAPNPNLPSQPQPSTATPGGQPFAPPEPTQPPPTAVAEEEETRGWLEAQIDSVKTQLSTPRGLAALGATTLATLASYHPALAAPTAGVRGAAALSKPLWNYTGSKLLPYLKHTVEYGKQLFRYHMRSPTAQALSSEYVKRGTAAGLGAAAGETGGLVLAQAINPEEDFSGYEAIADGFAAGTWDFAGSRLALALDRGIMKGYARSLLGTKTAGKDRFEASKTAIKHELFQARRAGVDLSLSDASRTPTIRGVKHVLGKQPGISDPFWKHTLRQGEQGASHLQKMLDSIGPDEMFLLKTPEMGKWFFEAYENLEDMNKHLWTDWLQNATAKNYIIPTKPVVYQAKLLLKKIQRPTKTISVKGKETGVLDRFGKPIVGPDTTKKVPVGAARETRTMEDYLKDLVQIDPTVTTTQWDTLRRDLAAIVRSKQLGTYSEKEAMLMSNALKSAAREGIVLSDDIATAKLHLDYDRVVEFTAGINDLYRRPTATGLGGLDRRLFKSSDKVTRYVDQVIGIMPKIMNSAEGVKDLRRIIEVSAKGNSALAKERMRAIATVYMDNLVVESLRRVSGPVGENIVINPMILGRKLGVIQGGVGARSSEALDILLKDTGVNSQMLRDWVEVMSRVPNIEVPAQMVARRFILGGISSGLKTFTLGEASQGATSWPKRISLLGTALLMRFGAKALNSPEKLQMMIKTLDEDVEYPLRKAAGLRLANLLLREDITIWEENKRRRRQHSTMSSVPGSPLKNFWEQQEEFNRVQD